MAYEFKKLSDVEIIDELSSNSTMLIEENGSIKRVYKNRIDSPDMLIRFIDPDSNRLTETQRYEVLIGSVSNVIEKLTQFANVTIYIDGTMSVSSNYPLYFKVSAASVYEYNENNLIIKFLITSHGSTSELVTLELLKDTNRVNTATVLSL